MADEDDAALERLDRLADELSEMFGEDGVEKDGRRFRLLPGLLSKWFWVRWCNGQATAANDVLLISEPAGSPKWDFREKGPTGGIEVMATSSADLERLGAAAAMREAIALYPWPPRAKGDDDNA